MRTLLMVIAAASMAAAADKTPPPGVYEVPSGFREKTELTLQDINE